MSLIMMPQISHLIVRSRDLCSGILPQPSPGFPDSARKYLGDDLSMDSAIRGIKILNQVLFRGQCRRQAVLLPAEQASLLFQKGHTDLVHSVVSKGIAFSCRFQEPSNSEQSSLQAMQTWALLAQPGTIWEMMQVCTNFCYE